MKKVLLLDTNIIIRFLLNDHPKFSLQAKNIFLRAEKGLIKLYLDEVVLAEVIWTLASFYKINKGEIVNRLRTLLAQDWIINSRKNLLLETLFLYEKSNLDYIDCWVYVVGRFLKIDLGTFDKKLMNYSLQKKQSPKR